MFVAMYQASVMNRQTNILLTQTKANAWPCLIIEKNEYGGLKSQSIEQYNYVVKNKGTGPAIIDAVRVSYKGEAAQTWDDLIQLMQTPDSILNMRTISQISKVVISANDEIKIIDYSDNYELINWVMKHGDDILVEIYYKSVFDETWMVKRHFNNHASSYPEKIEKYKIPEDELFIN